MAMTHRQLTYPCLQLTPLLLAVILKRHIERTLDLLPLLRETSVFLFGPRQTGKSTYIRWRSTAGHEVDFILDDRVAIEVKSSKRVTDRHLRGLRALAEEGLMHRLLLVSRDPTPRRVDGIDLMPWEMFLEQLWDDHVA